MHDVEGNQIQDFHGKSSFQQRKTLFTSKLWLNLRKELVKCYIWSIVLYGAETWTLRNVDEKNVESIKMWCWRRMEKISWTDRVKNEVVQRAKEKRNIVQPIKRRNANWISHTFHRNCILKQVVKT